MNYFRISDNIDAGSEYYINQRNAQFVASIKTCNLIVGANNSRKSRFLRQVLKTEHKVLIETACDLNQQVQNVPGIFSNQEDFASSYFIEFHFDGSSELSSELTQLRRLLERFPDNSNEVKIADLKKLVEDITEAMFSASTDTAIEKLYEEIRLLAKLTFQIMGLYINYKKNSLHYKRDNWNYSDTAGLLYRFPAAMRTDQVIGLLQNIGNWANELMDIQIVPFHKVQLIYIPVLRSSRKLEGASTSTFVDTIKAQYGLDEKNNLRIETGLDLYQKIEKSRNGHRTDRENFAAFEKFLGDVFFQSRKIEIIAVKSTSASDEFVKISIQGDMDDVAIHDLGDGIQALVILLLPIFTAPKGAWIFIDEPENNLHPGFQNVFLKAIAENPVIKQKQLRFFINTHSNHILTEGLLSDMDTEILVFSRRDKQSSNISFFDGNEHSTLEMLGVLNTSVLISNCSIWVEGVTDRLYLRAFLKAYCDFKGDSTSEPIEGFQYSFIEYAGNNLVHYSFDHQITSEKGENEKQMRAFFINSYIFLVADSDFAKEEKHRFYEKISAKQKKFHYHKTGVPEIENLLPDSLIRKWLMSEYKADEKEVALLAPGSNHSIKLGEYLSGKISKGNKKRIFTKKSEGGTLRSDYKSNLADFVHRGVAEKTITWQQLKDSPVIEKLVTAMYKFITQKNKGR